MQGLRTLLALAVSGVVASIWLWLSAAGTGSILAGLFWLIFGSDARGNDLFLAIGTPIVMIVACGTTFLLFIRIFQALRGRP
jgi:hypothetical protein